MTCASRFELARRDLVGNGDAGLSSHAADCVRCRTVLTELAEARQQLLGDTPIEVSQSAARGIMAMAADRRAARRFRFMFWLPVGLAPVAIGLLLFALPNRDVSTVAMSSAPTARAKGSLALEMHCKRGDTVFPVVEGADFFAGDRLRFTYTKAEPGFLIVFSVDDSGRVFPYYPDGALTGMEASAGSGVMLPGSVELDGHHGFERIFALWSTQTLHDKTVRKAVETALAADRDIRHLQRLPLEVEQVSYLLRRP